MKILIVEDDENLNIHEAFDLETARKQIAELDLDLLILDLNLSDGYGLELIEERRSTRDLFL